MIKREMPSEVVGCFTRSREDLLYRIENYDLLPPFLISLVNASNLWLYISSRGCLTAGRQNPDLNLFPYDNQDRLNNWTSDTGSFCRIFPSEGQPWEPFSPLNRSLWNIQRTLERTAEGDALWFEETNSDLGLSVRIGWEFSDAFGIVRSTEIRNVGSQRQEFIALDGLRNLSTFGNDRALQSSYSYLVDGYKRSELDVKRKLCIYHLNSRVTDKAEPAECLRASVVWSTAPTQRVLLDDEEIHNFERQEPQYPKTLTGRRFNFVSEVQCQLAPQERTSWFTVGDVAYSQFDIEKLQATIDKADIVTRLQSDIAHARLELRQLIGSCDGIQAGGDTASTVHHWANTMFNALRGGLLPEGDILSKGDFIAFVTERNRPLAAKASELLAHAPDELSIEKLRSLCSSEQNISRLSREYFPVYLSRRHGDPSRPWNNFSIQIRTPEGQRVFAYEGNWRDIFQNWEALCRSVPSWTENAITIFLNATSFDGNNAFRIKRSGIDWEVPVENDPHSNIGYWGDHQIPYLNRLLEGLYATNPQRMDELLRRRDFVFADIPYEIKTFEEIASDPWDTIRFNRQKHQRAIALEETIGGDGRLLRYANGDLVHACLAEKLLIPVLAKLSNLIPGAGIWMNTMRPEWNDANNALVGRGVSIVSLAQLRRHCTFILNLLSHNEQLSNDWNELSADFLRSLASVIRGVAHSKSSINRYQIVKQLGDAGSNFRQRLYRGELQVTLQTISHAEILELLRDALTLIDSSLAENRRPDGLYHAYNLVEFHGADLQISHLPEMLEGQAAILASGFVKAPEALTLLDTLFKSALFCPQRRTFTLYPERSVLPFLERNSLSAERIEQSELLTSLAREGSSIIRKTSSGTYRFAADFKNVKDLRKALLQRFPTLAASDGSIKTACRIYEEGLGHLSFTGRSSSMFAFEGNGSTYWHMVSKLLLSIAEMAQANRSAPEGEALRAFYWKVQDGIGYKKTPREYGAFPTDPYSHTPKHAGAQQPGMTGQVKEEVLTRWLELGIMIKDGIVSFDPFLLRPNEFSKESTTLQLHSPERGATALEIPAGAIGFSFCGIPIVLHQAGGPGIVVTSASGNTIEVDNLTLAAEHSRAVLSRSTSIAKLDVRLGHPTNPYFSRSSLRSS